MARTLVAMHQAPQDEWTLPRMAATACRAAFAAVFGRDAGNASQLPAGLAAEPCAQLRAGVAVKQVAIGSGVCRYRIVVEGVPQAVGASPRAWLAAGAAQAG